ncbi:hypothetical protein BCR32DRAFT_271648 [Anaeromyces robustus]|uniref:MARVEL domain-containing protein n=1 Tax=Anaeromyces robustus TaxID=1754192 RepID=A0A1Y1WRD9_9FUNG|nr:hypothetical protein BCR32DRAFT_271648 [Anaeromyces robustus]|eukprot:ORX75848.1 hypothetical protein BCR32DRAFT_271648 [Anaeromyces robustus]
MANSIPKRQSLMQSRDYIYPDFKKCQLILFTLAFLEYLNILILTIYNLSIKIIPSSLLVEIYAFEFTGLIFVILSLRTLNKKKWRKGKRVVLFFIYLIIHILFYVFSTCISCKRIWNIYSTINDTFPKIAVIVYSVCSGIFLFGQVVYFIIFAIFTKNTWHSGDESLV